MRRAIIPALLLSTVVGGCATPALVPDASRLAPWTTQLRDSQPEGARAAVYRYRGRPFVVVGATHSTDTESPTFRLINQAYEAFDFDTAIVEGVKYASGPNPSRLLTYVAESEAEGSFQPAGETVPAVQGALREGAVIWGGEPADSDVLALATGFGVSEADVLGFYVLRNVPQWLQERKIERPGDPRTTPLVEAALAKDRAALGLGPDTLPDYASWAAWYERTNGRPFGDRFQGEEVGPLADGPHGTNRAGYAISRARDSFLLERVADHLGRGEAVVVVYGASHLPILRPALDAMLGPACYVGTDLSEARAGCRD